MDRTHKEAFRFLTTYTIFISFSPGLYQRLFQLFKNMFLCSFSPRL